MGLTWKLTRLQILLPGLFGILDSEIRLPGLYVPFDPALDFLSALVVPNPILTGLDAVRVCL
jgi:hypothetical protein